MESIVKDTKNLWDDKLEEEKHEEDHSASQAH